MLIQNKAVLFNFSLGKKSPEKYIFMIRKY